MRGFAREVVWPQVAKRKSKPLLEEAVSMDVTVMAGCVAACLIFGQSAEASDESSGGHWLRKCTNPEPALQIECAIYVRALIEYDEARGNMLGQTRLICPAKDLTIGQSRELVISFLRDRPEDLHRPFVLLAHRALEAAFPCNKSR
jgi:hypothetical protein